MNLRRIRKARKMTMKQLGEEVGVTEAAIGLYETGKRKPSYEMLLKLSEALGCSVDDILKTQEEIDKEAELLDELRSLNNDKDFRALMAAYKKMTPQQVRIMKNFMKSMTEEEN